MAIRTFLQTAQCLPAADSTMLRGDHGIGKSALYRQLAKLIAKREGIVDFPFLDWRLSQCSEGDVIGLPSTDGEVTRFNPPDRYMMACIRPCFLCLDELNRATPEVMQAAFQIVLDRELNGRKLHPQSRVGVAVNNSAAYNVNEIDPALLDRFYVIDLNPDVSDWMTWAKSADVDFGGNIIPTLIDFISQNHKFLDPPKNAEPGEKHPSRRSWEKVSRALRYAGLDENPTEEAFYNVALGFVGVPAAIAFTEFARTIDTQITGEDVVNRYKKIRHKVLNKTKQEQLNNAIEKASEYIIKKEKITDAQGENLREFMKDLPGELRISLWTKLTQYGIDKLDLAKSVHKHLGDLVLDVFGVPMGEAGIGVVPNIPSIFKDTSKK
jgi:uncharacterized protein YktA (UPF0223 family)